MCLRLSEGVGKETPRGRFPCALLGRPPHPVGDPAAPGQPRTRGATTECTPYNLCRPAAMRSHTQFVFDIQVAVFVRHRPLGPLPSLQHSKLLRGLGGWLLNASAEPHAASSSVSIERGICGDRAPKHRSSWALRSHGEERGEEPVPRAAVLGALCPRGSRSSYGKERRRGSPHCQVGFGSWHVWGVVCVVHASDRDAASASSAAQSGPAPPPPSPDAWPRPG